MASPLVFDGVPRTWWFPGIPGCRPYPRGLRKYAPSDLDVQPSMPADLGPGLEFLHDKRSVSNWTITQDDDFAHRFVLSRKKLSAIVGSHPVPRSFETFAAFPKLQKKIRSVTGCHLDLGNFAVPIIAAPGVLCHFLSDQQWLKHWLIYCSDGPENGTVVAADLPYGFETDGQFEEDVPRTIDLATATDVTVCADSFEEFIYRFWVENELWNVQRGESISDPDVRRYAELLEGAD
jgi:hypothetical protein